MAFFITSAFKTLLMSGTGESRLVHFFGVFCKLSKICRAAVGVKVEADVFQVAGFSFR
jgi:hypothetical protein